MAITVRFGAALVLATVCAAFSPSPAEACGGAIFESSMNDVSRLVADAERALNEGHQVKAVTLVSNALPGLKKYPVGTGRLADRALRILSLSLARNDGGITAGAFHGKTAEERAENVTWAANTLRGLNAKRPNNPALETDLGEALSKVESSREEAAKLLGSLADKDLLATAEGYAALAKLRQQKGDASGRDAAIKRCTGMTKLKGLCGVAETAAASS